MRAYTCPDALTGRDKSCPEGVTSPASVRVLVDALLRVPPALPGTPCRRSFSSEYDNPLMQTSLTPCGKPQEALRH